MPKQPKMHLLTGDGTFTYCGREVKGGTVGTRVNSSVTCIKCLHGAMIFTHGQEAKYQDVEIPLNDAKGVLNEALKQAYNLQRTSCAISIMGAIRLVDRALSKVRVKKRKGIYDN